MLKTYSRLRRQENKIIENVHELCRLCLARADERVPIFGEVENACAALPMRIMICVGHEITRDDCLPNSICTNCHQELERYYKFRKKCEDSYLKLKAHYNATRYQESISKVQAKNKICHEENEAIGDLQQFKIQEEELQTDEMERLVIVDVFNIEEPCEYEEKPIMSSIAESGVNLEEKVETTEIQVIQQADDISPDISTFLNAILVELGILVKNDQGLVVQDQGVTSFELETGDDDHVEFELIEEDDEVEESAEPPIVFALLDADKLQDMSDSKSKSKNGRVRKNIGEGKKSAGLWCAACGRTFASRGALRRHAAVHSGARPHQCRDCGRCFAQKAVLQRHRLVHEASRPHKCPRCDKSYTQRGALAAHARAHAAGARALALHACARCDRMFLYASGLSRHMLSHNGRGFPCGTCARLFTDKSSLLRHTRSAHPDARPACLPSLILDPLNLLQSRTPGPPDSTETGTGPTCIA